MIFEVDKQILEKFSENDIKVHFYTSGCEGTKVNLTSDFEKTNLESFALHGKTIYFESQDKDKLEGAKILKKVDTGKGHQSDDKYLFISPKVESRCGCATSFSFEKKLIDKNKLKTLQGLFKK
ncbi:MAG: hypothetical protein AB7E37_04815 [Candidatus Altimarinota bacterium]